MNEAVNHNGHKEYNKQNEKELPWQGILRLSRLPTIMQGQLFTQDFLERGIRETPPWEALNDGELTRFRATLQGIYEGYSAESTVSEAITVSEIIEKVLLALGWDHTLPEVNLSDKGREDVPDFLLFPDARAKDLAKKEKHDAQRYQHGVALLEAKRWLRLLDRGDTNEALDPGAPSSQMLRYLSRVDALTNCKVKWGILTNGAIWRLYWQDARSRSEEFFEIDLAATLDVPGVPPELDAQIDAPAPELALRLFYIFFSRAAFLPQDWDTARRSFHAYALGEARLYEEKVSQDLGERVFTEIFPRLAEAIAKGDLLARTQKILSGTSYRQQYTRDYLDEAREATLVLLYRLLFLFYAEDRNLLPIKDARYAAYSVRRLRERLRDEIDSGKAQSSRLDNIWRDLQGVFLLIDQGDDLIGMPAYNGGLFDRARSQLLERAVIPDAVMAPILDALSRRAGDLLRAWINYRDLSVAHLGGIYERLLEFTLEHEIQAKDNFGLPEINRILARPASFARKVSGSYYTHDDLVRLLLRESVGRLADERHRRFAEKIKKLKSKTSLNPGDWDALDELDPASALNELSICDPAMGSGHFLVALVDDLADRILEAINIAEHLVGEQKWSAHLIEQNRPWQSPLVARIADIRKSIKSTAHEHGWSVTDAQLDDRHIVRRMILKRNVFGVDKNPMAVELAKTALWLHTFTVGAPLSFLDHHLRCGDSLHGEKLEQVGRELQAAGGGLFQESEMSRLEIAARSLIAVGALTDVDIAEAELSKQLNEEATEQLAPIVGLLDFWRALRWLIPGWPAVNGKKNGNGNGKSKATDDPDKLALAELLSGRYNLISVVSEGKVDGKGKDVPAANDLLARAKTLSQRENFFHWQTFFPDVFSSNSGRGGFDIVIGNPPWDRIKLQEVEWFAERSLEIAKEPRAADRKTRIAALQKKKAPLWKEYQDAMECAEANTRVLAKGGDFPLLGGGDVNLYSLFVERAQSLIRPDGLVALLTPSGIAADKGASAFFSDISNTGRLGVLYDFENHQNPGNPGGSYFPDVDSRFKFCALVFGGEKRTFETSRCAFYLHDINELDEAERSLELSSEDFNRVNPNTGAAPIFRSRRDADITLRIYREHPVLVDRSSGKEKRVWPVKYLRMFDMTNDSGLFKTRMELEREGFKPVALNHWKKDDVEAVPLYVGRMIHQFDHRHASVTVNEENLHNAASGATLAETRKVDPNIFPLPQYWILRDSIPINLRS
ncbi:MAG: hypothetical protein LBU45_06185, partial [Azoarcus sp.]|nr:hypothetical protein [Azoarcus sp.]